MQHARTENGVSLRPSVQTVQAYHRSGGGRGVLDRERKAACARGRRLPQLSITVYQQDLICITGNFQKINQSKHIAINVL